MSKMKENCRIYDFYFLFRYYKDPALYVKCILDGIPSNDKLTEEQTNAILGILGKS